MLCAEAFTLGAMGIAAAVEPSALAVEFDFQVAALANRALAVSVPGHEPDSSARAWSRASRRLL